MNGTLSLSNPSIVLNYQENELQISIWPSFLQSFCLLFIAELGDQTFITLLFFMMKFPDSSKLVLFSSLVALLGMNTLSVVVGYSIDFLLYKNLIDWIGLILFIVYGIYLLYKGWNLKAKSFDEELLDSAKKEMTEATQRRCKTTVLKKELSIINELKREDSFKYDEGFKEPLIRRELTTELDVIPELNAEILESPKEPPRGETEEQNKPFDWALFWTFVQRLLLAECGDRTQAASILMGAMFNIYGVLFGTAFALASTIILAIVFGEYLSKWKWLNSKILSLATGVVFICVGIWVYILKEYA